MTTPTIPMPNPTPFPQDKADQLLAWAAEIDEWLSRALIDVAVTYVEACEAIIQFIKDIFGDPVAAWEAATGWAAAAADVMDQRTNLADAVGYLASYWEGGAQEAFASHMTSMLTGMDQTATKLTTMSTTVATSLDRVLQTYEDAIGYLHDYLANLASLAPLPLSLLDAADIVKGFAEAMFVLAERNSATIGNYLQDILSLHINGITFPTVADNPLTAGRIDDVEDWDVQQTG